MQKRRWIPAILLVAYSAVLVRFVVFKAIPDIHIGHLIFRLGGPQTGKPNVIPFRVILFYLRHGFGLISLINLAGNIVPFVPVGFLVPFLYRRMMWRAAIVLGVAVGLAMEGMEAVFHVGILDIDDVILNGFGVVIGYGIYRGIVRRSV